MPIYEYRCIDCQHEYEKREGFDALALQQCPKCGGTARRVIHAPPILFKGSGFYVTDSRKSTPESESEAKSEAASKSETSGADKSASKSETSGADKSASKKDEKPAKDAEPAAAS